MARQITSHNTTCKKALETSTYATNHSTQRHYWNIQYADRTCT